MRTKQELQDASVFLSYRLWKGIAVGVTLLGGMSFHASAQSAAASGSPLVPDDAGVTGFFPRHFPSLFDDEDGMLDLSKILDHPYGFFPLVLPITEPAVGAGAAFVPASRHLSAIALAYYWPDISLAPSPPFQRRYPIVSTK